MLYSDLVTLRITKPEVDEDQEEDVETFLDKILHSMFQEPHLDPAPESTYKFKVGQPIKIELGTAVDPQDLSPVALTANLGTLASFLTLEGSQVRQRAEISET